MNTNHPDSVPVFHDDGFGVTAAEPWFKVKVQVINSYLQAFIANVAGKADDIIFVDLFSRGGLYALGHKKEIFAGSSLTSLTSPLPLSKWIFCESDPQEARALKIRVNKYFRDKNVVILEQTQNELVERLALYVPQNKGRYRVATLCLVDPFSLAVQFDTIRKLAGMGFNFLIPFTFSLNNRLNHSYYLEEQREKLTAFMGSEGAYDRMMGVESNVQFYKRLVRNYQTNMLMLGHNTAMSVHKIESGLMDIPAYYMGFFSSQLSTRAIQRDVRAAEVQQFELF